MDQIRCIGRDRTLLDEVLAEARAGVEGQVAGLRKERDELARELARHHAAVRRLVGATGADTASRLADLNDRVDAAERRLHEIDVALQALEHEAVDEGEARAAFAEFGPVWDALGPREQAELLALLVARVAYDAAAGTVAVSFHATGIKALSRREREKAA